MKRHERLPHLLALLSKSRRTAATLATVLGVCIRTVYRDILVLERLGYRIQAAAGRNGGFSLHPESKPIPLHLDTQTVVALAVCATTHDAQDTLVGGSVDTLLQPLFEALPAKAREGLEILTQQVRLSPKKRDATDHTNDACRPQSRVPSRILAILHKSFSRRKGLFLRIRRPKQRLLACYFEPETLALKRGRWHLEGWDSRFRTTRSIPVQRIFDACLSSWTLTAYRNQIPHPSKPLVRPGMFPRTLLSLDRHPSRPRPPP